MGIPVINFSFLKRIITQVDENENDLDLNSSDKIESELARSSEEIDKKFEKYNERRKEQRKKILDETKVSKEQLIKEPREKSVKPREGKEEEREHGE